MMKSKISAATTATTAHLYRNKWKYGAGVAATAGVAAIWWVLRSAAPAVADAVAEAASEAAEATVEATTAVVEAV